MAAARIGPDRPGAAGAPRGFFGGAADPARGEEPGAAARGHEDHRPHEEGEQRFDWVLAPPGARRTLPARAGASTRLPLDAQGVPRFDRRTGQIGDSHVFIAGDANSEVRLLHEAAGRRAHRRRTTPAAG
jgi:dihydrolipoamide dehydrogenase